MAPLAMVSVCALLALLSLAGMGRALTFFALRSRMPASFHGVGRLSYRLYQVLLLSLNPLSIWAPRLCCGLVDGYSSFVCLPVLLP